jgi:hypothetical protein
LGDGNVFQGFAAAEFLRTSAGTARRVWIDFLDVSNEIIN